MAKVLEAVSRYRKIEEVTSTKDDNPPVYLMDEVADIARSSPDAAQSVAEHICKRLGNSSPVVKWKALRLTKHLCNKGCAQFQKCMQRSSASVRDLTHYKGEPDPFKGDTLNQRVRELAKETIEILYATTSGPAAAPMQGRIQGFGSNAPGSSAGTASSGSSTFQTSSNSRMIGFGNAAFNNPPPPAPGGSSSTSSHAAAPTLNVGSARGNWGPANASVAPPASSHTRNSSYGNEGAAAVGRTSASGTSSSAGFGAAAGHGGVLGTEEQLVEDICTPGGLRPAPDPEDLRRFVEAASRMDGLRVGELMIGRLASPSWQVVLRTLSALEAVLLQGSTQACGEIGVMFQSDPQPVRAALSSTQHAVREVAARCLKLLVGEEVAVQAPAAGPRKGGPAAHAAAGAAAPDMLLGGGEPEQQQQGNGQAAAPADPLDLLGDLSAPAPATQQPQQHYPPPVMAAPAQAATFDPFAPSGLSGVAVPAAAAGISALGMGAVSAAPAAPAAAGGVRPAGPPPPLDDMFASLLSVSAAPQQPQARNLAGVPAPAPAAPAPAAGGDLLGGFDLLAAPVAPAPVAPAMGMGAAAAPSWQQPRPAGYGAPAAAGGMMGAGGAGAGSFMGMGGPSAGMGGMSGLGPQSTPYTNGVAGLGSMMQPGGMPVMGVPTAVPMQQPLMGGMSVMGHQQGLAASSGASSWQAGAMHAGGMGPMGAGVKPVASAHVGAAGHGVSSTHHHQPQHDDAFDFLKDAFK